MFVVKSGWGLLSKTLKSVWNVSVLPHRTFLRETNIGISDGKPQRSMLLQAGMAQTWGLDLTTRLRSIRMDLTTVLEGRHCKRSCKSGIRLTWLKLGGLQIQSSVLKFRGLKGKNLVPRP